MAYTVGSVPYVNAIPLVSVFEEAGESSPVKVVYDVPSHLPALLDSGQADAVLVSSIDSLRVPGRRMATGVCIGSDGPVKSVRLFSKVPPAEIQTLALDSASMTSNRLARIILAEKFDVRPKVTTHDPNLAAMLEVADACVLIGDIGMTSQGDGLYVLDLGEEWTRLTGKPFVWAAWIGGDRLTPELSGHLQAPLAYYGSERRAELALALSAKAPRDDQELTARRQAAVKKGTTHSGWTESMVEDYYQNVMVYAMDDRMLEGLREFGRRLLDNGFDDCGHFPALVAPAFSMP